MIRPRNIHTAKIAGYTVYALQGYNISCLALVIRDLGDMTLTG